VKVKRVVRVEQATGPSRTNLQTSRALPQGKRTEIMAAIAGIGAFPKGIPTPNGWMGTGALEADGMAVADVNSGGHSGVDPTNTIFPAPLPLAPSPTSPPVVPHDQATLFQHANIGMSKMPPAYGQGLQEYARASQHLSAAHSPFTRDRMCQRERDSWTTVQLLVPVYMCPWIASAHCTRYPDTLLAFVRARHCHFSQGPTSYSDLSFYCAMKMFESCCCCC
jgi:hypothetical protein